MDSEEYQEVQKMVENGVSSSNEGPFYHHTFWQSYKGAIKGKLGGLVIGGLTGLAVATVAFALISLFAPAFLGAAGAGLSTGGFFGAITGAGMMYGVHEFGDVGRISGAIAASTKDSERRMHEFELAKFTDIKQDINEIKSLLGKPTAANDENYSSQAIPSQTPPLDDKVGLVDTMKNLADHRLHHLRPELVNADTDKVIFWKVAMVGLVVGVGIGLLIASGSGGAILAKIGMEKLAEVAFATKATGLAITFGAIGASFGVNRDFFRKVFDKTDMLFKGMFNFNDGKQVPQLEQQVTVSPNIEKQKTGKLVEYDSAIKYPDSDSFYRDKINKTKQINVQSEQPVGIYR